MTPRLKTIATAVAALAAAVVALWIYGSFDPAVNRFFPRCMVKVLTGLDCPGCGSQRALHALLSGDPAAAWRSNAAFVISLPLIAVLAYTRVRPRQWPRLTRFLGSRAFILALFVLTIAWTIWRNL